MLIMARNGTISRSDGGMLLITLLVFTIIVVRFAQTEDIEPHHTPGDQVSRLHTRSWSGVLMNIGLLAAGITVLVLGARTVVAGAVTIAELAGISERIIGLTIVAAGTSLPELAASVVATMRKESELALANVIGSNIFNILMVLGTVSLVRPISVAPEIIRFDLWWMLGASLVLFPFMFSGRRVGRLEGAALLIGYVVYLAFLLL